MKTGCHTPMRIWKGCPASSSSRAKTLLERLSPSNIILNTTLAYNMAQYVCFFNIKCSKDPFSSSLKLLSPINSLVHF